MSQEYTPQTLELALQAQWADTGRFAVKPDDYAGEVLLSRHVPLPQRQAPHGPRP